MPNLYLDLTELLSSPIRTGIQRVEWELLRHWPAGVPFQITRFDTERGLVVLPDGIVDCLGRLFRATGDQCERFKLELQNAASAPIDGVVDMSDERVRVVVPEVFWDSERIRYYSAMTETQRMRTFFLVFDLLPLTHPAYFGPTLHPEITSAYFRLIRESPRVGFISESTRKTFFERLRRSPDIHGPAFYLGSDSLGPRPDPTPVPICPTFSAVGTIEPRKNHRVILEAFRAFQQERPEARLRFYGNLGWQIAELSQTIALENGGCGFEFVENPSDSTIREGIMGSTATIYASEGEGFGLPPVESLWLGTPAIATRQIPSLEKLGGKGVVCLNSTDPSVVIEAMRTVSRGDTGIALREEARSLELPTWGSFARSFCDWVAG